MLQALRIGLATRLMDWGRRFQGLSASSGLQRGDRRILIFFHGYSMAHTIRPLVMARALRDRGYPVLLAGRGPHAERIQREGFAVHDVETMPQERMDQHVQRGEYGYYDAGWIGRCLDSERALMRDLAPALVIHDMKPTVSLAARLEGIDEAQVTQAYNQPGYAEPIPTLPRLATTAGQLEQFLVEREERSKPQRRLFLMADIPAFHPPGTGAPGYHYVGPLLDRPPRPQHVEVLDDGWDTSLPLIYLTCGSTGRPPDYLDELTRVFRDRPYRLLVTTAGRWSGQSAASNVRIVDFLPGEWVLSEAHVLTGVVGVGAVYQALSHGVPIVGAPEHLDQEYHLNRVEKLGLGLKLERRDFAANTILSAVERVLAHPEEYRQRCRVISRDLEEWQGGRAVADVVDRHFHARYNPYRVDRGYAVDEREFLRYLDTSTPNTLSEGALLQALRRGIRRGLPHEWRGRQLYYDRLDSWNWLYDHEPSFFASDYWALEQRRQRFFVRKAAQIRSRKATQRYRACYIFRILPGALAPGQRAKVFLPYPIAAANQSDIRLLSCAPVEMTPHFAPFLGFFYGYGFTAGDGDDPVELVYTCELTVEEVASGRAAERDAPSARERQRYLGLEPGFLRTPEVAEFRRELAVDGDAPPELKARRIYEALARTKRFRKTKDPTQSMNYSAASVLRGVGGHCITLSRAFIGLCRAEGIPARERTGALIGYPAGEDAYVAKLRGEPVFGHTWAEVFLEGQGWTPVEFHAVAIGETAMTADNVTDPHLRARIMENSPKYLDYYFGHLDTQRLMCANAVKRMPQCVVEKTELPAWDRKRWSAPDRLDCESELRVACI